MPLKRRQRERLREKVGELRGRIPPKIAPKLEKLLEKYIKIDPIDERIAKDPKIIKLTAKEENFKHLEDVLAATSLQKLHEISQRDNIGAKTAAAAKMKAFILKYQNSIPVKRRFLAWLLSFVTVGIYGVYALWVIDNYRAYEAKLKKYMKKLEKYRKKISARKQKLLQKFRIKAIKTNAKLAKLKAQILRLKEDVQNELENYANNAVNKIDALNITNEEKDALKEAVNRMKEDPLRGFPFFIALDIAYTNRGNPDEKFWLEIVKGTQEREFLAA